MASSRLIDTSELWDTGDLGEDERYVTVTRPSKEDEAVLNESLGIEEVSIRMNKDLVEDFKRLAETERVTYKGLMKRILKDYIKSRSK